MGFFGGRKKDGKDDANGTGRSAGRSRRIVVPGQGGQRPAATPAAPPAPAAPQKPASPTPARPGTVRVSKPAEPPAQRPASAPQPQAKRPGSSAPLPVQPPAQRPKTKEPIRASKPPEFAGDLAGGARSGPCRTGDNALLEFLINKAHLLDAEQAENIRGQSHAENQPIDMVAVAQGLLTEEQLVNALTQECWVPHLKVDKYEIRKKALDTIAREDALHFGVFPVDKLGSLLTLAMVNPLDAETIRVLESKTGLDIKKVVATRSEITQGIEKYYSGQVVAKDTSLAFTQDVEPKSVTQMLSKVSNTPVQASPVVTPAPSTSPSRPRSAPAPAIVPEIQDIDELLSADDIISPAIIEPVNIEPVIEEPVMLRPEELEPAAVKPVPAEVAEELEGVAIAAPNSRQAPAPAAKKKDDGLLDLDIDITSPDPAPAARIAPAPARPAPAKAPGSGSDIFAPSKQPPQTAPLERSGGFKLPPASPAPVPARPAAPVAPVSPVARAPVAPVAKPTTARLARPGTGRQIQTGQPSVVNLVPVMEEEFQHAITHGKAHLFEKWVGLQTRNRIINGVPVEEELAERFAGMFASPRKI